MTTAHQDQNNGRASLRIRLAIMQISCENWQTLFRFQVSTTPAAGASPLLI
jgi:hypothetical protein